MAYTRKWSGPDQDYWRKLNKEEKQWLWEFNQRYYKGKEFVPQALTKKQYALSGRDGVTRKKGGSADAADKAATRLSNGDVEGFLNLEDMTDGVPSHIITPEGFGQNYDRSKAQKGQPSTRWKHHKK